MTGSEVAFSSFENGAKAGATVSITYQIKLKKVFAASENQHLSFKLTEGSKFLNFIILLNLLVS